jgi:hypothetical protein
MPKKSRVWPGLLQLRTKEELSGNGVSNALAARKSSRVRSGELLTLAGVSGHHGSV